MTDSARKLLGRHKRHMRRVFNKLGVSKRSAVVARVLSMPYSGAPAMCNATWPNDREGVRLGQVG